MKKKKKPNKLNKINRKKLYKKCKQEYINKISKYNDKVPFPTVEDALPLNLNSWFTSTMSTFKGNAINIKTVNNFPENVIKCKKVIIKFSNKQHKIIIGWMRACELMFNRIIKYFKASRFNKTKYTCQYKKLRKQFKTYSKELVKTYSIPVHILDCSIKRACATLKSCLSNLKNGHIKKFRLRYLKEKSPNKIIEIEPASFSKNHNAFCTRTLGISIDSNKFDLRTIRTTTMSTCTLHYNKPNNIFTLLVPKTIKTIENKNNHIIAIDPGVRTFSTGLSDNHVVELGTNIAQLIQNNLNKIDNFNNSNLPSRIKKRYGKIYSNKIKNLMTEVHWKIIKYLTDNYKVILIGNWSTKNIGKRETSVINRMTKRIASRLRYYNFLQKLKYKCESKKINLQIIDERYTSKLCSKCGWENKKLKGSKTFNCKGCGLSIDRDINSARGIMIKAL